MLRSNEIFKKKLFLVSILADLIDSKNKTM